MAKKVKISQEQADAIERYLKCHDHCDVTIINSHASGAIRMLGAYQALDNMSVYTMSRAILSGYEIELEFKTGDWVVYNSLEGIVIGQLQKCIFDDFRVDRADKDGMSFYPNEWRHATNDEIKKEKERRMWKTIGREVGEFRERDVGYARKGTLVGGRIMLETYYDRDMLVGFFPEESFISLGDDE